MATGYGTLSALLMEIAMDAANQAGAIANTIQGAFAIRMEDARRHAPAHERAAILQGLAYARDSALSAAAAQAALDVHGRQQTAIAIRLAQQPPARGQARHPQQGPQKSVVAVVTIPSREADAEPSARSTTPRGRAGTGRSFRQAARVATQRTVASPRRRSRDGRQGGTSQTFRTAARASTRPVFRISDPAAPVAPFLSTTLDWFELWDNAMSTHDECSGHLDMTQKYLFPGL